jgi:hypothetical protein
MKGQFTGRNTLRPSLRNLAIELIPPFEKSLIHHCINI